MALTCGQNDVSNYKRGLVGVESPVYFIDSFLDLQCQTHRKYTHSIVETHLSRIVWSPIDKEELSVNTCPPGADGKLGN